VECDHHPQSLTIGARDAIAAAVLLQAAVHTKPIQQQCKWNAAISCSRSKASSARIQLRKKFVVHCAARVLSVVSQRVWARPNHFG
jgi:hypothetical protein